MATDETASGDQPETMGTGENAPFERLTPLQMREGRYDSQALGRVQPYAFLAPADWNGDPNAPTRYPLLVMLHGRDGHYRDWLDYTRIARYAAAWSLIIAFPEGDNGWYTNAYDGTANYEDDLTGDFVQHLQQTFPLLPPGKSWGIGGLSMGGYGAVKTALKRPDLFLTAFSHSGALEKPRMTEPHPVFGDPQEDRAFRRQENPFSLAEQALCRWPTERPRLHLDCGASDELLGATQRFHDHLTFIGYAHSCQIMPGYHTWPYWDRAFRTLLPAIAQQIGAAARV